MIGLMPSLGRRAFTNGGFRRLLAAPRAALARTHTIMPVSRAFSWKSMFSKIGPFFATWGFAAKQGVRAEAATSAQAGKEAFTNPHKRAHVYFLLDRSGSMQSIADDVIGGFNSFVKEQQSTSSDSAGLDMTMVQFDSANPQEVLFSLRDIGDVPLLCDKTFQPRAMTPLFDALGGIISMAEEAEKCQKAEQQIVIVTFSDGMENSSREHSRKSVFSCMEAKQKQGWTFVFLGANQDSYAEGGRLGHSKANIQNFKFDAGGAQSAWSAVSGATQTMRRKLQSTKHGVYDNEDFFDGVKSAEDDYTKRK